MSNDRRANSTRAAALGSTTLSGPPGEAESVFMFYSGKGGVGKSTEAANLNHHFRRLGKMPTLVDGDFVVQDYILAHHEEQECHGLRMSEEEGYTALADVITEAEPTSPIIVSCPGAQVEVFNDHVQTILFAARSVGRKVFVLSPLDLHVNSYDHVPDLETAAQGAEIYLLRPRWFGRPDQFRQLNQSELGRRYLAAGRVIDVPLLPEALSRAFKDDHHSLSWIEQHGSGGERASLEGWREKSRLAYARFLG